MTEDHRTDEPTTAAGPLILEHDATWEHRCEMERYTGYCPHAPINHESDKADCAGCRGLAEARREGAAAALAALSAVMGLRHAPISNAACLCATHEDARRLIEGERKKAAETA